MSKIRDLRKRGVELVNQNMKTYKNELVLERAYVVPNAELQIGRWDMTSRELSRLPNKKPYAITLKGDGKSISSNVRKSKF